MFYALFYVPDVFGSGIEFLLQLACIRKISAYVCRYDLNLAPPPQTSLDRMTHDVSWCHWLGQSGKGLHDITEASDRNLVIVRRLTSGTQGIVRATAAAVVHIFCTNPKTFAADSAAGQMMQDI